MKIYTRAGDQGETGLLGPGRTAKDSARIAAIGDVDELNSAVGLCVVQGPQGHLAVTLPRVQAWLFELGSELAAPGDERFQFIEEEHSLLLEESIDHQEAELSPLRHFVLPGGSALAAQLHLARSICRRAERSVLALHRSEPMRAETIRFLNRLSDWFFVSARTANRLAGVSDVEWSKEHS
ncbi:MAG TPA: cob(I)yrinic acid a,c-diamide adenosyltransferase [Fimbriimonadaceae bacterium]|nr:cob(I)yrinic acid a,c-diamide adenosyltransferase [Fimbriimonadaceae bacterium]